MSERIAIEFDGVGKMYRLYKSRLESFLDITSLGRAAPWWNPKIEKFWALRNVSFKLKAGSRLGIIGRNGAGKTTLLKLTTGNLMPTEGRINVQGQVQALLEVGAGFHPEFSGYENVEASLTQNGLSYSQIKAAVEEIAEFTELGDFLGQPFKTYSAGMQARLVFTTATTIRPDILIIDEILGAGDAYFAGKSRGRMKKLVEGGASVLLVAHAMDQILQFCEEAIWLERGRIVLRGPSMEVVKAYEEFIHTLQDRQLKDANRRRSLGFRDAVEIGHFANTFIVALSLSGSHGARADIAKVDLLCEEVAEETLRIGDPQDCDQTHFAYVATNTGTWGDRKGQDQAHFRSLTVKANHDASALGEAFFRSHTLETGKQCSFRIRYRILGAGRLTATVSRNGRAVIVDVPLPAESTEWREHDLPLPFAHEDVQVPWVAPSSAVETVPAQRTKAERSDTTIKTAEGIDPKTDASRKLEKATAAAIEAADLARGHTKGSIGTAIEKKPSIRRWPGEGSLLIDDVVLLDADGKERAVYRVGSALTLCLHYRATKKGSFPVIYAVAIHRVDGIKITQHVSAREIVHMEAGERRSVQLEFPSMDLADGHYVISPGLHRELDPRFPGETVRYDQLAYSYAFEVNGNPPLRTSLFVLPASWEL